MSGDAREIGSLDNLSLEGPGIASDAVEAIRLALPKGRMQEGVLKLLSDAGIDVRLGAREYRPSINLPNYDVKMLKPQNILEMLDIGSRDLGFAGHDWVLNLGVDVIELLDTQMDPVRIVVAGRSPEIFEEAIKGTRQVIIASEYEKLTKDWIQRRGVNARFVRAYGATESFPPEDADLIVDNAATGSTLKANGLIVFDEVMRSSTRLFCSREAFNNPEKRKRLDNFVVLLNSVLLARSRVLVEFNIETSNLDEIVKGLPCMRAPTIAKLQMVDGYSIRIAIDKNDAFWLLPKLKHLGATDVILTGARQILK